MPTIIALNPRPKAKKRKRKKRRKMSALQLKYFGKGRKKMTKKRKKRPAMTALQKKYFGTKSQRRETGMAKSKSRKIVRRRNPKKRRSVKRYARRTLGGVNMMGAAKSTVPLLFGALIAKFAAKKFAEGGAEGDNWNWKNYMLALAGGFVAAFGTSAIIRKPAAAQKVFEGALLLVAYKLFTNEIAPMNTYTDSWFSGDEGDLYDQNSEGNVGDIWAGSNNEDYVKGIDGYWRPTSESHRVPAGGGVTVGDVMVNPDPQYGYGDVMVNPNPRYGDADINQMIENDEM